MTSSLPSNKNLIEEFAPIVYFHKDDAYLPLDINIILENSTLKIFGDGSKSRVFCHVNDSVKAILGLASNNKTIGEVFNVGGVGEISISDLARKIIKQTSSNSEIIFVDYEDAYSRGFEDLARRVPDISKIKSFINWEPQLDLNDIVEDVIKSYS
jgi:UDP-glucose 4-epimerase